MLGYIKKKKKSRKAKKFQINKWSWIEYKNKIKKEIKKNDFYFFFEQQTEGHEKENKLWNRFSKCHVKIEYKQVMEGGMWIRLNLNTITRT